MVQFQKKYFFLYLWGPDPNTEFSIFFILNPSHSIPYPSIGLSSHCILKKYFNVTVGTLYYYLKFCHKNTNSPLFYPNKQPIFLFQYLAFRKQSLVQFHYLEFLDLMSDRPKQLSDDILNLKQTALLKQELQCVVKNAGCARSRYTLKLSLIF